MSHPTLLDAPAPDDVRAGRDHRTLAYHYFANHLPTKGKQMNLVRQGDVPCVAVASIPVSAKAVQRDNGRVILAYGEVTGHAHALHGPGATLLVADDGGRYLAIAPEAETNLRPIAMQEPCDDETIRVEDASGVVVRLQKALYEDRVLAALGATLTLPGELLVHEEHDALVLAPGLYSLPGQREYQSKDMPARRVAD